MFFLKFFFEEFFIKKRKSLFSKIIYIIYMKVVLNSLIGAVFFGLFTYFTSIYEENPDYLKISAFLWSAPLFYFFMVYITWSEGKDVMLAFTRHALIGTILTICVFLLSIVFSSSSMMTVLALNIIVLCVFVSLYFYLDMYRYV